MARIRNDCALYLLFEQLARRDNSMPTRRRACGISTIDNGLCRIGLSIFAGKGQQRETTRLAVVAAC